MGAKGRSGFCIPGERQHRLIAAAKELLDLAVQLRQRTGRDRPARIDHNIPRRTQLREPCANDFAHPPLEAIASNGIANRFRSGETDAWTRTRASEAKSRKERPAVAETVVINFAEFARS